MEDREVSVVDMAAAFVENLKMQIAQLESGIKSAQAELLAKQKLLASCEAELAKVSSN